MSTHEGRVAIVTGAAGGIGREVATKLAERGARVVLLDLEPCEATHDAIRAVGGEAMSVVADVASERDWAAVRAEVEQRFGRADILINNAGIYPFAPIDQLDYALFSRVLRVNLDGTFLGVKTFSPMMTANGWGRIVNLTSNSIGTNLPGLSHYMASKMGIIGLTRGLANDLGEHGITVNAIAPAITRTPGTSIMPSDVIEQVWQRQAIRRFAEPGDIVGPILFLTSDDAAFVTGQTVVVDGGMMKL